ncbi:MAG: transposase, partial [Planctomycetaceae bacterium]
MNALRGVKTLAKVLREMRITMRVAASGARRWSTFEFRQSAVRVVMPEGLSLSEAARQLGVRESLLRNWRRSIKLSDS